MDKGRILLIQVSDTFEKKVRLREDVRRRIEILEETTPGIVPVVLAEFRLKVKAAHVGRQNVKHKINRAFNELMRDTEVAKPISARPKPHLHLASSH